MARSFRNLLALCVVGLSLAGCSVAGVVGSVQSLENPVTMRQVYIAQATYDAAVLAPAANYRRLGLCAVGVKATLEKPCADRKVISKLQVADRQVQSAFNNLKLFLAKYPGQLGAVGLYDAVKLAIAQAQEIIAIYGVNRGSAS